MNVNKNIPNELFGDSVRIRQVAINFLTNAVKYTQVGNVTFNRRGTNLELAKQLELAGKMITAADSSESEKQQGIEFIKANHAAAINSYDALAEDCKKYLQA